MSGLTQLSLAVNVFKGELCMSGETFSRNCLEPTKS